MNYREWQQGCAEVYARQEAARRNNQQPKKIRKKAKRTGQKPRFVTRKDQGRLLEPEMLDVYRITCVRTNRAYVGVALNSQKRFRQHMGLDPNYKGSNRDLMKDVKQFGVQTFKLEVLCRLSTIEALLRERIEIAMARRSPSGCYNVADGGEYPLTKKLAKEYRLALARQTSDLVVSDQPPTGQPPETRRRLLRDVSQRHETVLPRDREPDAIPDPSES